MQQISNWPRHALTFLLVLFLYACAAQQEIYEDVSKNEGEKLYESIDLKNIDISLLQKAIFIETNKIRKEHHLRQFLFSPYLEQIAQEHSNDMVTYGFFSHDSPVPGKETLRDRLLDINIKNSFAAENIAKTFARQITPQKPVFPPSVNGGYFSYTHKGAPIALHTYQSFAASVVNDWMNSPGHRVNILNPDFLYLGCGTALELSEDPDTPAYILSTQNFSSKPGMEQ